MGADKKKYQKIYNKKYAADPKNRQRILQAKSKYNNRQDLKNKRKGYKLKSKFGMTLDEYNKMFQEQNGLCKLCSKPETARHRCGDKIQVKDLSVDHSHKTGKIRGLLCSCCNRALGYAQESIEILENMIKYLEEK